jgi:uncharacterized protein YerC
MQLSKKNLNQNLKNQIYKLLYQVITDLKTPSEVKEFLVSFLGENELEVISRRLGIVYFLDRGKTYADIKKNLGVSSTTIASIIRGMRRKKGFKIALQKIHAEQWAEKWSQRLSKLIKIRPPKS